MPAQPVCALVSVTGESEYFEVPNNGSVHVGQFYEAEAEITPTQLTVLGSQTITLEGVGSEKHLSVLATYSNGTTRTVTAEVFGTNYTSSNPAVATVDANGVIRSVASGVALISVRKDGVLTVAVANVVTSGDTDGDGIPDDIELANGMNPNDPVDAFEDQDKDGLSALQEYQLGTGINNPDSDGDGINDGEEVALGADGYITNPLLADTDNDGIPDGLELTLGSNPTDINDAPYGQALIALNVAPKSAVLFYNTIDPESSLQMKVTGTLVDDSEIDLTSTSRGTNYTSSDLTVASFGAEPGKVFAGVDGIATVTAVNNGYSGDLLLNVITHSPQPLGFIDLAYQPANLFLSENSDHVFVITTDNRLLTIAFSEEAIELVGTTMVSSTGFGIDLVLEGAKAYVLTSQGITIFDVTNPVAPLNIGNYPLSGGTGLDVKDGVIYVTAGSSLSVLDARNPSNILLSNSISVTGTADDVKIGDILVVQADSDFYAYDLLNPLLPQFISSSTVPATVRGFDVKGRVALLATFLAFDGFPSLDFSTPTPAFIIPNVSDIEQFAPSDIAVAGNQAFYSDTRFTSAMPYTNVSNPANPLYQGLIDMSRYGDKDCSKVTASISHAACFSGSRLFIAKTREILDNLGIPPIVGLQQPSPGSDLFEGRKYRFQASAVDDFQVASVSFVVNGEVVGTDTTEPYEMIYTVPANVNGLQLEVTAIDWAGNEGTTGLFFFNITLPAGLIDESWNTITDFFTDDYIASSITMDGAAVASAFAVTSLGDVTVSGAPSSVKVKNLIVEGNLIIDGSTLSVASTEGITVLGDVIIKNGGRLTTFAADAVNQIIYPLNLSVAGEIRIEDSSGIDVSGKGYPANTGGPDWLINNRLGCHGGVHTSGIISDNCIYGRYQRASYAGSGGVSVSGGGIIDINDASIFIAPGASLSAKGNSNDSTVGGGAGGAIHIESTFITGSGKINVAGGKSASQGAGGGRISLYVPTEAAVAVNLISGESAGGAGTIYIKTDVDKFGHLIFDNGGISAAQSTSRLNRLGKHTISLVELIEPGLWRVSVAGTPWLSSDTGFGFGVADMHVYLDETNPLTSRYNIQSNTANSLLIATDDDLNTYLGQTLQGVYLLDRLTLRNGAWLDVGEDDLVILEAGLSSVDSGGVISGAALSGFLVEFALASGGGVISNLPIELDALTVVSDLTTTIQAPSLLIHGDASLTNVNLQVPEITVEGTLTFGANTTVNSDIVTANNLNLDNAFLTSPMINVAGDLSLTSNAVITSRMGNGSTVYPLDIDVAGTVSIATGSSLDVTGDGYGPSQRSGPAGDIKTGAAYQSCHGGRRYYGSGISTTISSVDCSYGDYREALFAGGSPDWYGHGGGILRLTATNLLLDGVIRSNGTEGLGSGGAGGSIHLNLGTLSGTGGISAVGAGTSVNSSSTAYSPGAGGRISVYVDDRSGFSGTYQASGLSTSPTNTSEIGKSGAGTVYVKESLQSWGHLLIDNAGTVVQANSTPIHGVGRHTITAAQLIDAGEAGVSPALWQVSVAGAPWVASDVNAGKGVQNNWVDLDAVDVEDELYRIRSNTSDTLLIEVDAGMAFDGTAFIGEDLIGVHRFETLNITNGAQVNFGADRVEVLDLLNSSF